MSPLFAQSRHRGAVLSRVANDRHGAGDEQPSQIAIALLGNAAEPFLAAGRVLFGYQTDPGRKTAPRAECAPVADLGNQGRGDDRTNAGDLLEPSARFAGSVPSMDTLIDRCDLGICNDLPGNQLGGGKLDRSLVGPLSVCRERSDYMTLEVTRWSINDGRTLGERSLVSRGLLVPRRRIALSSRNTPSRHATHRSCCAAACFPG